MSGVNISRVNRFMRSQSRLRSPSKSREPLAKPAKRQIRKMIKNAVKTGITGWVGNQNGTSGLQQVTAPANLTMLLNCLSPTVTQTDNGYNFNAPSSNFSYNAPMPRNTDVVKFTAIHIRGMLYSANANSFNDYVRLTLYVDKMAKAGQPNVNQVLDSNDSPISVWNSVAVDFKKRFTILHDKIIHMNTTQTPAYSAGVLVTTGNSTQPVQHFFEIKKKLNFLADYSRGTAGTYADFDGGQLVLGLTTMNGTTSTWTLKFMYNLEYEAHNERHDIV